MVDSLIHLGDSSRVFRNLLQDFRAAFRSIPPNDWLEYHSGSSSTGAFIGRMVQNQVTHEVDQWLNKWIEGHIGGPLPVVEEAADPAERPSADQYIRDHVQ